MNEQIPKRSSKYALQALLCCAFVVLACDGNREEAAESPDETSESTAFESTGRTLPSAEEPSSEAQVETHHEETGELEESSEATFFALRGEESEALQVLRQGHITDAARGGGGRSVSFRVTLEHEGQRVEAFFKPEQATSSSRFRSETAAFYLDRELGFGRVPPLAGRLFDEVDFTALLRRYDPDRVVSATDGMLRGPVIWWIPGELRAWPLGQGWEQYVRVEGALPVTPYQSPAAFRARASGRVARSDVPIGRDPPTHELSKHEAAQLSDLIVFDYLISNVDRWGSDYTNVRRVELPNGQHELVFLDQGAGFWERDPPIMERRLEALQRFVPSTIDALRRFDLESFRTRLSEDPLSPVLSDDKLNALEGRVERALAHIDACVERFGRDALIE